MFGTSGCIKGDGKHVIFRSILVNIIMVAGIILIYAVESFKAARIEQSEGDELTSFKRIFLIPVIFLCIFEMSVFP